MTQATVGVLRCVLVAALTAALSAGCSAGASQVRDEALFSWHAEELARAARYSAALEEALDGYENEVNEAVSRWYPSYTEAYAAALAHIDPRWQERVAATLAAHQIDPVELADFAERNPWFVRSQNFLYAERMAAMRPAAYAIMGRIDAGHRATDAGDEPGTAMARADAPRSAMLASRASAAH